MTKKKKIVLLLAVVLLVIAAGVAYYFYDKKKKAESSGKLTDKNGNTFELTTIPYHHAPAGFQVLVNGQSNGALVSMSLGSDGLVHGVNGEGYKYVYSNGWQLVA